MRTMPSPRGALSALTALVLSAALAPALAPASPAAATAEPSRPRVVVDPLPDLPDGPRAARGFAPRAAYPLDRTFALHSNPGARRVVHIDVDGATVSGTAWNGGEFRFPAGFHAGWDTDGDPSSFSAGELAAVQEVWARVAEDYAPFDVDVTTEDPGEAGILRSGIDDTAYGMTALVTDSARAWDWCGRKCGGVAFVDVFDQVDRGRHRPAWIFPAGVADRPAWVAEAVSHEVGHTFGLEHDGHGDAAYHEGHGSWGPIMGAPYQRPVTQWSDGSYPGATQQQDDVALIAAGAGLRPDEGTTLPAGTAYVTRRTDTDAYDLGACTGTVTVTALPAALGADLDPRLTLVDPTGAVVAAADPSGPVAATITRAVSGAGWRVVVDGVGAPSLGYDDYGSLGAYTLAVTGCGVPAQPADEPADEPTGEPTGQPAGDPTAEPEPEPEPEPAVVERPGSVGRPTARSGARGGDATARVSWTAPTADGGAPVAAYQLVAYRVQGSKVLQTVRSEQVTGRAVVFTWRAGTRWRFAVRARNSEGWGPLGPRSRVAQVR